MLSQTITSADNTSNTANTASPVIVAQAALTSERIVRAGRSIHMHYVIKRKGFALDALVPGLAPDAYVLVAELLFAGALADGGATPGEPVRSLSNKPLFSYVGHPLTDGFRLECTLFALSSQHEANSFVVKLTACSPNGQPLPHLGVAFSHPITVISKPSVLRNLMHNKQQSLAALAAPLDAALESSRRRKQAGARGARKRTAVAVDSSESDDDEPHSTAATPRPARANRRTQQSEDSDDVDDDVETLATAEDDSDDSDFAAAAPTSSAAANAARRRVRTQAPPPAAASASIAAVPLNANNAALLLAAIQNVQAQQQVQQALLHSLVSQQQEAALQRAVPVPVPLPAMAHAHSTPTCTSCSSGDSTTAVSTFEQAFVAMAHAFAQLPRESRASALHAAAATAAYHSTAVHELSRALPAALLDTLDDDAADKEDALLCMAGGDDDSQQLSSESGTFSSPQMQVDSDGSALGSDLFPAYFGGGAADKLSPMPSPMPSPVYCADATAVDLLQALP